MNRSALSVLSNIAEGAGRGDNRDFARFLRMARGSACELEAQAHLGARLKLFDKTDANLLRDRIERVKASITNLERRLTST
jgi:four helix bundle protein